MTEGPVERSRQKRFHFALAVAVILATLLSGSEFFLKRIGVIDHAAYKAYLFVHRTGGPYARGLLSTQQYERETPYTAYLFRRESYSIALKLAKDVVVGALILVGVTTALKRRALPSFRAAWPAWILLAAVAISFFPTLLRFGLLLPLAGVRAFSFLLLALLLGVSMRLRGDVSSALSTSAFALLGVESLLVIVEAIRGLPMWGYLSVSPDLTGRLSGSFVIPSTLGIAAVVAFTVVLSSEPAPLRLVVASILALFLVIASSSGTGAIILGGLSGGGLVARSRRPVLVPVAAVLAIIILALPLVIGRKDLFQSLPERVVQLQRVAAQLDGVELLTGKALGAGTGAGFHLLDAGGPWAPVGTKRAADSLPAMLLMSTGVVGVFSFYALLFRAALKDRRMLPFWIAIALSSLTISVIEIFPLSLFLASALAPSFARDAQSEGVA